MVDRWESNFHIVEPNGFNPVDSIHKQNLVAKWANLFASISNELPTISRLSSGDLSVRIE